MSAASLPHLTLDATVVAIRDQRPCCACCMCMCTTAPRERSEPS